MEYETEDQQWEAIKKWFKRYGNQLSWALIIILSIIVAGNYWRHHREVERERSADQYMSFLLTAAEKDKTVSLQKGDQFILDFPRSPYAALVAFSIAKDYMNEDQLDKAEPYLRRVMAQGEGPSFKALGRVRLMRLLFAKGDLEGALRLYDEKKAEGFLTEMAELKGDILLKQENQAGAITAYKLAYASSPANGMIGPLLKMKMENVGIDLEERIRE